MFNCNIKERVLCMRKDMEEIQENIKGIFEADACIVFEDLTRWAL